MSRKLTRSKLTQRKLTQRKLTRDSLLETTQILADQDPYFARVLDRYGPPPLWDRQPGFATLLGIILEQQVSLASRPHRATAARLLWHYYLGEKANRKPI